MQPALRLASGRDPRSPAGGVDGGSRSDSSCTGGSAPLSLRRGDSQVRAQAVVPSISPLLGAHVVVHRTLSPASPGSPAGRGPGAAPGPSHHARPARWMSRPIWPRPGGIRTGRDPGTSVRGALAYDSAEESDAAAGERGGKVLVPHAAPSGVKEMLLHVLGRPPPGLFVGGAAGSHPGRSPGSLCTWPAQPLGQACAWNIPFPAALVKRINL